MGRSRINAEFLLVKDESYDIYVLMDAASCYVLGHLLSRVVDESPQEKDVRDLFQAAFRAKNPWANILILTGNAPADDVFRRRAEQEGLPVKTVGLSDLEPISGPLKASFASDFMKSST
jgi:hypothetical protein